MNRPWKHRVRQSDQSPEAQLQELRQIAQDLRQAAPSSGRVGTAFRTVYEVVLLGTAAIGAIGGGLHLWQKLTRKDKEHEHRSDHGPQPEAGGSGSDRRPPGRHTAALGHPGRDDGHGRG